MDTAIPTKASSTPTTETVRRLAMTSARDRLIEARAEAYGILSTLHEAGDLPPYVRDLVAEVVAKHNKARAEYNKGREQT